MPVPYLLGSAGAACLATAGAAAVGGRTVAAVTGLLGAGTPGLPPTAFRPVPDHRVRGCVPCLADAGELGRKPGRPGRRGLGAAYALALGAVAVILIARDAFTLLFAWETLTLSFYLLSGYDARPGRPAPP